MSKAETQFVYVTYIVATRDAVWRALTDPEITKRYWIHANVSDWKPGSAWEHQRIDGSGVADVVGYVIENVPEERLVFSWAAPGEQTDPAKVSRVRFDLAEHKPGVVRLTVTHYDLEPGSGMERGISEGWPQVLSNLKTLLETGTAATLW